MAIVLLIIGLFLFILGLGYLYRPQLVLQFNAFFRDTFFKDSIVLLSNRRVGLGLFLISFILISIAIALRGKA